MSPVSQKRTVYCAKLNASAIGQTVTLCGWVNRRRDHGGVVFIDLRDHTGLAQIVCDPQQLDQAHRLRPEWVLAVTGTVDPRPEGTVNPNLASGEIEVNVQQLEILNTAQTPPFVLDDTNLHEDTRLSHRFIDLRRPQMQENLRKRADVIHLARQLLIDEGFSEIETPILTRQTPEGARDYLVPSRLKPGQFYALPQSPQLFKQLLMVGGFDRYFQIARCFRDEDLRADRQPEFTQIDCEMSFADDLDIMGIMEQMVQTIYKTFGGYTNTNPFPRLTHDECLERFGTDRPDTRIPFELVSVTDLMKEVEFKVFSGPAQQADGRVALMTVPQGNRLSRTEIDNLTQYIIQLGAKGMAYIRCVEVAKGRDGLQSPILKFIPDDILTKLLARAQARDGDLIVFGADKAKVVAETLGALRVKLAQDLDLIPADSGFHFLWVVDFPMFDYDEQTHQLSGLHHPFTAPRLPEKWSEDIQAGKRLNDIERPQLLQLKSNAYDLVVNGVELGGGSARIHNSAVQRQVLQWIGLNDEDIEQQFGFMLSALDSGAPPHCGIAFGLDRIVMQLCGAQSIREVIAFPKTQTATCLTTNAPSQVKPRLLRELSLSVRQPSRQPEDASSAT